MFVEKLTKKDLDTVFNSVGLEIDYNHDSGMRYPVDVLENSLLVRCVNPKTSESVDDMLSYLRDKMAREEARSGIKLPKSGMFQYIESEKYQMYVIEDFGVHEFCPVVPDEEQETLLLGAYINYMAKKFPDYQAQLDAYIDTLSDEGNGPND